MANKTRVMATNIMRSVDDVFCIPLVTALMLAAMVGMGLLVVVGMGEVGGQLFNRCSHSRFLFHILTKTQNLNPATNLGLK